MKKILSVVLSISLMLSICSLGVFNIPAKAATTSGTTGDCTWTLDGDTLTISGNGAMAQYNTNPLWKSHITKVIIQNGVTSIHSNAFASCSKLASITIPNSVTDIGKEAFIGTAYYNNSSNWENGVLYIGQHLICAKKDSLSGNYIIKSGTKIIAQGAFHSCYKLTNVIIPNSITSISNHAFYNCNKLTGVTIPDSVTSIGNNAFYGCSSLTSVTIPDSTIRIGEGTFRNCSNLTGISIPNGVTDIDQEAFSGCTSLTSITIPNSVTDIGESAFRDCSSLTSVTIPDSVTDIGNSVFKGCDSLEKITIPFVGSALNGTQNTHFGYLFGGRTYLYNSGCVPSSLKEVVITNATRIADNAFNFCKNLKRITIPNSVKSIDKYAFSDCSGLTSINIPASVASIGGGAFSYCSGLTSINIPTSVTNIGAGAFVGCNNLTSITIPSSVENFSASNFIGCKNLVELNILTNAASVSIDSEIIKKMSLPESISTINGDFSKCSGLVINYKGTKKYWETVELSGSLQRAILEERVKVVYEDDNKLSSSNNPVQATTSSKPTVTVSSKPAESSKPAVTVSSKPNHSGAASSKPAQTTTSSKTAEDNKTSSVLTQSVASEIESNILTEIESEPTGDTASENISSQIGQNTGGVSPIAVILIAVGAVVFGAGAAVGVIFILKKKNKF
ncbi:MAG: leucine-rich repeat domain-containing protein [Oscillospiraceae bacterium]|nr:leucine-rich repeat domain-containing protein [Oscillospiraceae bacterium]